jgi:hypothetical protein
VFLIGGSEEASELDAKRAIDQGTRLAAQIEDAKSGQVLLHAVLCYRHDAMAFVIRRGAAYATCNWCYCSPCLRARIL